MPRPGTLSADYPVSLSIQTLDGQVHSFKTSVFNWSVSYFGDNQSVTVNGKTIHSVADWKSFTHYPDCDCDA